MAIYQADVGGEPEALAAALRQLAEGLASTKEEDLPAWLQDGGAVRAEFCQRELLCPGSPQDYLRGVWRRWRRHAGAAGPLVAALGAAAEALAGEPDPWALAPPPAQPFRLPGGGAELLLCEADYLSSGTGRFVYGAAKGLAGLVAARAGGVDVRGKRVLEVGCGVGLVGLACMASGAAAVTFTDFQAASLEACAGNLAQNASDVGGALPAEALGRCLKLDWQDVPSALPELLGSGAAWAPADTVLGADVCYEPDHAAMLLAALQALGEAGALADGAEVFVLNGWPNRGLRRFEELLGITGPSGHLAVEECAELDPERTATPHARRFLQEADPPAPATFTAGLGGLRVEGGMLEVSGCTDERGAPAAMRLYRLSWRGSAAAPG